MRKTYKYALYIILVIVIVGTGAYGALYVKDKYRTEILKSQAFQRLIPLYRSLRKIPDIVFMPWSAFAESHLEKYELTISPQNIGRMNAVLPEEPFNSGMDEDSKLWVSAYFRAPGYEDNVKVRYRGNLASHWNAYQKSYAIKFPKDHLFDGMKEMNLIIPSRRSYLAMSLNDYRAEKLNLIHPNESFVHLELNGADMGVMLSFESWSQEWIEKMPISSLSTIYGVDEGDSPYRERWDSWNSDEPVDPAPLDTLAEIVDHASDDDFARLIPLIIDIDDWYSWDIMRILAGGYHIGGNTTFGSNNLVIIFDRTEGRFKPVPYNIDLYTPSYRQMVGAVGVLGTPTNLYQRILSIPEFRTKRDERWTSYVETEKANDLAYLQEWQSTYNREFLLDNAKNDNNFMYLSDIKESVATAQENFDDPYLMTKEIYEVSVETKQTLDLPDAFRYLYAASADVATAAKQHPSIIETNGGLLIPSGSYWYDETIIIPVGTHLTIAPGATLHFKKGTSFISYSPITAEGTKTHPITITGYDKNESWGVFAVVNAGSATSSLSYVLANNGGEATINGAYISGTLAFHNSNVIVHNVTITNANGDDGINVKGSYTKISESSFINNSSDGIDLDYVNEASVIENNDFEGNKGDALDISWSDIHITKNMISASGDKGISVGESSRPIITNNKISRCEIGIAVKDSSYATITDNIIYDTGTAISAYQKKPFFGGGTAVISGNTITENEQDVFTDELSKIITR